ncbi:hypothetical protein EJB05_05828, partial [Eragrostis curvula]
MVPQSEPDEKVIHECMEYLRDDGLQGEDAVYGVKALDLKQPFSSSDRNTGTFRDAHVLKEAKCLVDKCGGIPESVFSQVKRIRRSHFVRRWITEGYCKSTDRKTREEYAGELFNRLAKHTSTMAEWRNNSFFHEYINSLKA